MHYIKMRGVGIMQTQDCHDTHDICLQVHKLPSMTIVAHQVLEMTDTVTVVDWFFIKCTDLILVFLLSILFIASQFVLHMSLWFCHTTTHKHTLTHSPTLLCGTSEMTFTSSQRMRSRPQRLILERVLTANTSRMMRATNTRKPRTIAMACRSHTSQHQWVEFPSTNI